MRKWLGGGDDPTVPAAEVDLRVGGRFRVAMKSEGGGLHVAAGEYKEVRPPERLVFTWTWAEGGMEIGETLVTVDLREREGGTEVSLTHERLPTKEARRTHADGWTTHLNLLQKTL